MIIQKCFLTDADSEEVADILKNLVDNTDNRKTL